MEIGVEIKSLGDSKYKVLPVGEYKEISYLYGTNFLPLSKFRVVDESIPKIDYKTKYGENGFPLNRIQEGVVLISNTLGKDNHINLYEEFFWGNLTDYSIVPCLKISSSNYSSFLLFTTLRTLLEKSLLSSLHKEVVDKSHDKFNLDDLLFIKSESCEWVEGLSGNINTTSHIKNQVNLFTPGLITLQDYVLYKKKGSYNGEKLDFTSPLSLEKSNLLEVL